MRLRIYRRIGNLFPKSIILDLEKKLKFAGINKDAIDWLGERFVLALLLAFSFLLFTAQYISRNEYLLITAFLTGFVIVSFIFYLELFFLKHKRTKTVEKVLPDYLLLMVSNLRAGIPPYTAFVHSARPEFGALYDGIKTATAKLGGKASVEDALDEVSSYFDSPTFRRIAIFFGKGMKAGGQIAKLLERSAEEIRKIQDFRNELVSGTRIYTIFLMFIVVLVMPFLLAVSTHFLITFIEIKSQSETPGGSVGSVGSLQVFSGNVKITPDEMANTAIATLIITSFLVSVLLGVISTGMAPYGIKYFPLFAVASTGFYMLTREIIKGLVSSVIGG